MEGEVLAWYGCGYGVALIGVFLAFTLLQSRTNTSGCNNIASLIVAAATLYSTTTLLPFTLFLSLSVETTSPQDSVLLALHLVVAVAMGLGMLLCALAFVVGLWNPERVYVWRICVGGILVGCASALLLLVVDVDLLWIGAIVVGLVIATGSAWSQWYMFGRPLGTVVWRRRQANKIVHIGLALVHSVSIHIAIALSEPITVAETVLGELMVTAVSTSMAAVIVAAGLILYRRNKIKRLASVARPTPLNTAVSHPIALRWIIFDRPRGSPSPAQANNDVAEMRMLVDVTSNCPPVTEVLFGNCPAATVAAEMTSYCEAVLTHLRSKHRHVPSIDHQVGTPPISIYVEPNPTAAPVMSPSSHENTNTHYIHSRPSTGGGADVIISPPARQRWIAATRRTSSVRISNNNNKNMISSAGQLLLERRRKVTMGVDRLFDLMGLTGSLDDRPVRRQTFLYHELVDSTMFLVTDLSNQMDALPLAISTLLFRWVFVRTFCAERLAVHRLIGMDDDPIAHPPNNGSTPNLFHNSNSKRNQHHHHHHHLSTIAPPPPPPLMGSNELLRFTVDRKSSLASLESLPNHRQAQSISVAKRDGVGSVDSKKLALSGRGLIRRLLRYVRTAQTSPLPKPKLCSNKVEVYLGLLYVQVTSTSSFILVHRPVDNVSCLLPIVSLDFHSDTMTFDHLQSAITKLTTVKPPSINAETLPPTFTESIYEENVRKEIERAIVQLGVMLGTDCHLKGSIPTHISPTVIQLDSSSSSPSSLLVLYVVSEMSPQCSLPPKYSSERFQLIPTTILQGWTSSSDAFYHMQPRKWINAILVPPASAAARSPTASPGGSPRNSLQKKIPIPQPPPPPPPPPHISSSRSRRATGPLSIIRAKSIRNLERRRTHDPPYTNAADKASEGEGGMGACDGERSVDHTKSVDRTSVSASVSPRPADSGNETPLPPKRQELGLTTVMATATLAPPPSPNADIALAATGSGSATDSILASTHSKSTFAVTHASIEDDTTSPSRRGHFVGGRVRGLGLGRFYTAHVDHLHPNPNPNPNKPISYSPSS